MVAGLVPLAALWAFGSAGFLASTVATAATFFTVGVIKARVLGGGLLASGVETLVIGGGAAVLAYSVAAGTKGLLD
jgi:VIT1/CCC1 family predicted Fe2+/Mn2+ transporter